MSEPSRDEIVATLFSAVMSGDVQRYCDENGLHVATLRNWKVRHLDDYVHYLEAVLYRIKDQIDY